MKKSKKNAWIIDIANDFANESLRRVTIPREALEEAGWNLENCFYIVNQLKPYGCIVLTQDGSRKDIDRTYSISKCNGYPVVQVNFNPIDELKEKRFYRVAVEVDFEEREIWLTPLLFI